MAKILDQDQKDLLHLLGGPAALVFGEHDGLGELLTVCGLDTGFKLLMPYLMLAAGSVRLESFLSPFSHTGPTSKPTSPLDVSIHIMNKIILFRTEIL